MSQGNVAPVKDSLVVSPTPPPDIPSLWNRERAEDIAVRAGILDIPFESLRDAYSDLYTEAHKVLTERREIHSGTICKENSYVEKRLNEYEDQRQILTLEMPELRAAQYSHREHEIDALADIHGLLRTAKEIGAPLRLKKIEEASARRREREIAQIKHIQDKADLHAAMDSEFLNTNRSAIDQFLNEARARLNVITDLLSAAQARSQAWQLRGLSLQAARFLIWASLFSLSGAGVIAAPLFASRIPVDSSSAQTLYQLRHSFGIDEPGHGIFSGFGNFVLLMTAMFLIVIVMVLGISYILKRFDPSWGDRHRSRSESPQSTEGQIGDWISFFRLAPPEITSRLGRIDSRAHVQLLAALPIVAAAALTVFIWMLISTPVIGPPVLTVSLKHVSLGFLFAVLVSSSGLLLWLQVLRPHLEGENVRRGISLFYWALFVLPFLSIIAAATLPHSSDSLALAAFSISIMAALIGLGHGIYLQGLFLREAYLEQEQYGWQAYIAQASIAPTARNYVNRSREQTAAPPKATSPQVKLTVMQAFVRMRDAIVPMLFFLHKGEKQPPSDTDVKSEKNNLRRKINRTYIPALMIAEVNEAWKRYLISRSARLAAQQKYDLAEEGIKKIDQAMQELLRQSASLAQKRVELLDTHDFPILKLRAEFNEIQQAILDAYSMGQKASPNRRPISDPPSAEKLHILPSGDNS